MAHIILSAEQTNVLEGATTPVEIRDEKGRVVGQIPAPSEQEILQRIKRDRAAGSVRYPADQVEKRLKRLQEIRGQEGLDEARMRDLLRRMRAGEEV